MSNLLDRALDYVGLTRKSKYNSMVTAFNAAKVTRLNSDWVTAIMSPDQEVRSASRPIRARSRELVRNNDYAKKFISELKKNVIGPNGITLQASLTPPSGAKVDQKIEDLNQAIEDSWNQWCERGNCTADGKMSMVDFANLWIATLAGDGEVFTRKVKNYPHNKFKFALQLIDADRVDQGWQRTRRWNGKAWENEVRMGVEVDDYRRSIAYYVFEGHPSEAGASRIRIDASEIEHAFLFMRPDQTRGIPFLHTAMEKMNMLGGYEFSEAVAARLEACQGGFFTSKTGEESVGATKTKEGSVEIEASPGMFKQLPEGVDFKPFMPNHPNTAYAEFTRSMLRGIAAGGDIAYASISGDLRDVNFSSIRQGVLQEREAYKALQAFAVDHLYRPVFKDWFAMAITTGQLQLPSWAPTDPEVYFRAIDWQGRGWTWVDPYKDSQTAMLGIKGCISNLQIECAALGRDWRKVARQRKRENDLLQELGLVADFSGLRVEPVQVEEAQTGEEGKSGAGDGTVDSNGAQ